jgi:diaminohydroxyphosphoribosylaminopyrimidine deaminase/5-amino-6-(5-phosphoribosylamino)uracil reductase
VNGRGFKALREAGIRVTEGVLAGEAEELNRAYFHYVREGTPYITLKLAATLDGRIASSRGDSKWITGEKARKAVHRLRGQVDAVMVGVGTVAADNPRLTARGVGRNVQPVKIVLDPALRTPLDSYILSKDISGSTVLVIGEDVPLARCSAYLKKGAQILKIPVKKGSFSWKDLAGQLVVRGVLHVLVEGGGVTAAWALREGSVNRMELFLAPKLLGASGIPAVGDLGPVSLGKAVGMSLKKIRRIGEDLQVTAEPM